MKPVPYHTVFLRFLQVTHTSGACSFVTISDCPGYRPSALYSCAVLSCRAKGFFDKHVHHLMSDYAKKSMPILFSFLLKATEKA
ncbi:hypothetical protein BDV35DRAFT_354314 [Aspergillus flavus]|uniref:Uncharacterized protein n=1 Tax=Aspergillus flavus TaxID=5059 RepID=A0A5N6GXK2_ASPFL|nr:hypothetical protein BDV35DRAFT_354314 [Aspergillus flavus]